MRSLLLLLVVVLTACGSPDDIPISIVVRNDTVRAVAIGVEIMPEWGALYRRHWPRVDPGASIRVDGLTTGVAKGEILLLAQLGDGPHRIFRFKTRRPGPWTCIVWPVHVLTPGAESWDISADCRPS
jgi:hypothetical protein